MSSKKAFIVISLTGNHEIEAEDERDAWNKAIARGWKPLFVKQKVEDDEKEAQAHL